MQVHKVWLSVSIQLAFLSWPLLSVRRLLKWRPGRGAMQKVPMRHRARHLGSTAEKRVDRPRRGASSVLVTRGRADGALMPCSAEGHTRLCLAGRPNPMRLKEAASLVGRPCAHEADTMDGASDKQRDLLCFRNKGSCRRSSDASAQSVAFGEY